MKKGKHKLINFLSENLEKDSLNQGYFAPRKLKSKKFKENFAKALIDFGLKENYVKRKLKLLSHKKAKNRKGVQKLLLKKKGRKLKKLKKEKVRDFLIEPAGEMINKRAPAINILDYGVNFQEDGMNPIKHFAFVDY